MKELIQKYYNNTLTALDLFPILHAYYSYYEPHASDDQIAMLIQSPLISMLDIDFIVYRIAIKENIQIINLLDQHQKVIKTFIE